MTAGRLLRKPSAPKPAAVFLVVWIILLPFVLPKKTVPAFGSGKRRDRSIRGAARAASRACPV